MSIGSTSMAVATTSPTAAITTTQPENIGVPFATTGLEVIFGLAFIVICGLAV